MHHIRFFAVDLRSATIIRLGNFTTCNNRWFLNERILFNNLTEHNELYLCTYSRTGFKKIYIYRIFRIKKPFSCVISHCINTYGKVVHVNIFEIRVLQCTQLYIFLKNTEDPIIIFAGLKSDLEDQRKVPSEDAKEVITFIILFCICKFLV